MSVKRQPTEVADDQKNYNIYCVHIHGSCLNSIKDEFKCQIQSGLRQSVFIVDLNDVVSELNNQASNSKRHNKFHEHHSIALANAVLQRIRDFRKKYDLIKGQISAEFKLDLYQYWLKEICLADAALSKSKSATSTTNKARRSDLKKIKFSKNSNETVSLLAYDNMTKGECTIPIVLREHNRTGKPELLSKRQVIHRGWSKPSKVIYYYNGTNDLIRQDEPLQGIIHYVPAECKYDIMLGNSDLGTFISETIEEIESSTYELRHEDIIKSVGLFTYDLPVISSCMATKFGREIFDQLTWSIYDIDVLKQQYEAYYCIPYRETDVGIPLSVDLKQLNHAAESLSVQGHFLNNYLPGSVADWATIFAYLDSLLNACELSDVVAGESESDGNYSLQDLSKPFGNTFLSITKIPKWERLIVAENNQLLYNMLQYIDPDEFRNIYLSCLEYNNARRYVLNPYQGKRVSINPLRVINVKHLPLPKYVKYYANTDCCLQRISELLEEYKDYHVDEIYPGCKLYTFKRTHYALFEDEQMVVIPTRLCFRDFTLFQSDAFLKNLKTPEKCKTERKEENKCLSVAKNPTNNDIDENIFVLPNSLQTLKSQTETSSEVSTGKGDLCNEPSDGTSKLPEEWLGLPPESHILKGYNLGDVRQEIKIKNTKYYYDSGFVKLYEESFCFQDTNKELILGINNSTLFFNRPRYQQEDLWKNFRLITKNNVSIRILNDPKECSKIVMNYPNGLTVYKHDMHCEQIWNCNRTPKNEQHRLFTPFGAIIVFFKAEDMILIMRYNGEVYKLYQHEVTEEEEEQEVSENMENSSGITAVQAQVDNLTQEGYGDKMNAKNGKEKYEKIIKLDRRESKNTHMSLTPTSIADHLKTSINDELRFLNYISSVYHLNYLHLTITTSQGKRIDITNKGKVFEGSHCNVKEWHDYFANEAYCQRSDGVKMIWTKDNLKCYHKDGSVLTTRTEESFESADIEEFESQISQSSSRNKLKEYNVDTAPQHYDEQKSYKGFSKLTSNEQRKNKKDFSQLEFNFQDTTSYYSNYLMSTEGSEEYVPTDTDTRYISYTCSSWLLQHHHYAQVNIHWVKLYASNPLVQIEILGIDGVRIHTNTKELIKNKKYHANQYKSEVKEDEQEIITIINVWVGENLQLTAHDKGIDINAVLERSAENCNNIECDRFTLRLKYSDNINEAFKYLVNEIATLKNYFKQKTKEIYFMEQVIDESTKRGFEFLKTLPILSKFSNEISNFITEVKPLKTISELMTNIFEGYEADMNKFPRFKKYQPKSSSSFEQDFPKVLSTKLVKSIFVNFIWFLFFIVILT